MLLLVDTPSKGSGIQVIAFLLKKQISTVEMISFCRVKLLCQDEAYFANLSRDFQIFATTCMYSRSRLSLKEITNHFSELFYSSR